MILNDLNTKVEGRFFKEVIIDDDGDNFIYVFPDTKEFLSMIRRNTIKKNWFQNKNPKFTNENINFKLYQEL